RATGRIRTLRTAAAAINRGFVAVLDTIAAARGGGSAAGAGVAEAALAIAVHRATNPIGAVARAAAAAVRAGLVAVLDLVRAAAGDRRAHQARRLYSQLMRAELGGGVEARGE